MDALRGIAMWLGVVLHSIMAYQIAPRATWPHDESVYRFFDVLYDFLHAFRMPLFFVIAGFFANFLSKKIGTTPFALHRVKRIVYPFLLSIALIVPLSALPFAYNRALLSGLQITNPLSFVVTSISNWTGLYHLWFLYYLILLYAITIALQWIVPKRYELKVKGNDAVFLLSTVVLVVVQHTYFDGMIEAWTGLMPKLGQLLYFGYFYYLGYVVFNDHSFLMTNIGMKVVYFLLGATLVLVTSLELFELSDWGTSLVISLRTNLLILGSIGVFNSLFAKESVVLRYFSDSSYWFYLIHLPIVCGLQLYMLDWDISGLVKAFIVIVSVTAISTLSYEYLVRYTWIGVLLNGRKKRQDKLLVSVVSSNE